MREFLIDKDFFLFFQLGENQESGDTAITEGIRSVKSVTRWSPFLADGFWAV